MTIAMAANSAMAVAERKFSVEHPEIQGVALDTVRHFSWQRFQKVCTADKVADPRFETEAPDFAYYLMVSETLLLAKSLGNPA